LAGVIINLLILAIDFALINDKYKENLERIIKFINEYSKEIKKYFIEKYGHDLTEGIENGKLLEAQ